MNVGAHEARRRRRLTPHQRALADQRGHQIDRDVGEIGGVGMNI